METLSPAFLEAIAGRYLIEREVGRGGMATVYLARDVRHQRPVAVKILHPSIATALSEQRFLREIIIAARLNHPNILPLLDSGEAAGFLFYVMPYVEDKSLGDLLSDRPVLAVDEAVRIAAEIAEALDYAHAHDIVHRDIKPGNILLVAGHPVVSDFGIARAMREAATDTLTQSTEQGRLGTPAYMSPEQAVDGARVDGRSDIYSLGVVLHEMLTGARPSRAAAVGVASSRPSLNDLRRRSSAGDIPRNVEDAVERALAIDPAARFERAADFARALTGRLSRRPRAIRVAAMVTLIAVAAYGVAHQLRRPGVIAQPPPPSKRVVVAQFANRTRDPALDYLGVMAADWVTEGLQRTGIVDVVPTPTALQASRMADSQPAGGSATAGVRSLADETNAGIVITGSYYAAQGGVEFQVQVADVAAARLLGAVGPIPASLSEPTTAIENIRSRVMGVLSATLDERIGSWLEMSQPPTFDAYRAFAEGLDEYLRTDFSASERNFVDAFRHDSTFAAALLMASISLSNQGAYGAADSVLSALSTRQSQLNPYNRRWYEFRRSIMAGDRPSALRAVRALAQAAPGSKATYNWAVEAMQNGYYKEAHGALLSLPPDKGPMRGWAPYWDVLGRVEHLLGDHEKERLTGERAQAAFPDRAYVLGTSVRALGAMGRVADVEKILDAAERMPADPLGNSAGDLALEAGIELRAHGHPDAARRILQRGLRWHDARVAQGDSSDAEALGRARTEYELGNWSAAHTIAEALAARNPANADYVALEGSSAARDGDMIAVVTGPVPPGTVAEGVQSRRHILRRGARACRIRPA